MSINYAFVSAFLTAIIWCIRYKFDRPGATSDFKWIITFVITALLVYSRHDVPSFITRSPITWGWGVSCICSLIIASAIPYILRYCKSLIPPRSNDRTEKVPENLSAPTEKSVFSNPLKPLLFPCRTSHTRVFPKNHSFSYSYLFVGIPIGWRGAARNILSADLRSLPERDQKPKTAWFSVESDDYLNRGDSPKGLQGKLEAYLESQVRRP